MAEQKRDRISYAALLMAVMEDERTVAGHIELDYVVAERLLDEALGESQSKVDYIRSQALTARDDQS